MSLAAIHLYYRVHYGGLARGEKGKSLQGVLRFDFSSGCLICKLDQPDPQAEGGPASLPGLWING